VICTCDLICDLPITDYLKQASINSNRLWLAAGKPRSGHIFNDRQSCRMAYRKRLRDEQRNETSSYTNALHDVLIQKKGPTFWKCWRSKFTTSSPCIEVGGCNDSTVIADNFSNYFKKIYNCNDQTRADKLKADFYKLRNGYCGLPVPCDLDFDTE